MTPVDILISNIGSALLWAFGIAAPIYFIFGAIGLTGFRELSQYQEGHTFYYRLNPLTKIFFTITVTFVVATTGWYIDICIALLILVTYLTLVRGVRKLLLGAAYIFAATVVLAWYYALNTPYTLLVFAFYHQCFTSLTPAQFTAFFTPLWSWPSYYEILGVQPVLTLQGMLYGLQISTRAAAVLIAAFVLIMTSTPSSIMRSLAKLKLPVVMIFALVVGMRTVPRIFDTLDTAIKVQFMRGYAANANKATRVAYYIGGVFTSIVPAMTFLFRGARNMAISADTRAFRAYKKRTYLQSFTFSKTDILFWGIIAGLIVLAVLANVYGLGRAIPYAAVGSGCGATSTA